jgi:polar amino acid transport system substrate-binding protein
MPGMVRIVAILIYLLSLAACDDYPRDPKGSLKEVENQVLKVGAAEFVPWITFDDGKVTGTEAELVEQFARSLGAKVEWIKGSEGLLMNMLEANELHLVVGGITADSPWARHVALTRPYHKQQYVICSTDATVSPQRVENQKVALAKNSPLGLQIKDKGGIPDRLDSLENHRGLIAISADERDRYSCGHDDVQLKPTEHVMAIPMGENALLMAVEKFLHGGHR